MIKEKTKDNGETLCLNGLKGLACLIIAFIWHYQHFAPAEGYPFYKIFNVSYRSGLYFVELFFMLSGLVMTLGYGRRVMEGKISFGKYMLRRIVKIYPLYLIALFAVTAAELLYRHLFADTFVYGNFNLKHFLMHFFCLQGGLLSTDWSFNAPAWCISVCFVMYILFFLILRNCRSFGRAAVPFFLMMVAGFILVRKDYSYPVINTLIGRGLLCFPIGVMIAVLWLHNSLKYRNIIGAAALTLAIAVYIFLRRTDPLMPFRTQMIYTFALAPLIILAALYFKPLNRLLATSPVQYLGKLSLPVYLLHFFVQCVFDMTRRYFELDLNYSSRKVWLLYVASVLLVAALYYELIEKRLIPRLSSRLRKSA